MSLPTATAPEGRTSSSIVRHDFVESAVCALLDPTTGMSSVTITLKTPKDPRVINLRFKPLFERNYGPDSLDAEKILKECKQLNPCGAYIMDNRKSLVILYMPATTTDSVDIENQAEMIAAALQRFVQGLCEELNRQYMVEKYTRHIVRR